MTALSPSPGERHIVVYEQRPWWTPELQRQFLTEPVRVQLVTEPRAAATEVLSDPPPTFLLHLDTGAAAGLQLLARLKRLCEHVDILVITAPRLAELEWHVRELGATDFVAPYASGDQLASGFRRIWAAS